MAAFTKLASIRSPRRTAARAPKKARCSLRAKPPGVAPLDLAVAQLSCVQAAANEILLPANLRADRLKERIAWQSERIEMTPGGKISRELASRRQSWARRRWWRRLLSPDLPACRAPDSSSRSPVLVGVPVRI